VGQEVPAGEGGEAPAGAGAAGTPLSGGTLGCSVAGLAAVDPHGARTADELQVARCLFDPLTVYDCQAAQLVGRACTSWESNEDATQFTFHLREGAAFHDGDPVTSASFVRAWNLLVAQGDETAAAALSAVEGWQDVRAGHAGASLGLTCPDDYTLSVDLAHSYADFPFAVARPACAPLPPFAADDPAAFAVAPVGNGAFKLDGEGPGEGGVRLVRNGEYLGQAPYVDAVDFVAYSEDGQAWDAFAAGSLDLAAVPPAELEGARARYGASTDGYAPEVGGQVLNGAGATLYYLCCNTAAEPLSCADLRAALSCALDRAAACDGELAGTCAPAGTVVVPGCASFGAAAAWELASYDPAAAAERLGRARDELGAASFELELAYDPQAVPEGLPALVQADLFELGVAVELAPLGSDELAAALDEGSYQLACLAYAPAGPSVDDALYPLVHSLGAQNFSAWSDPALDAALDDARRVVDAEARMDAQLRAAELVGQGLPVIPLAYGRLARVASSRVDGLYVGPFGYADMASCWLSA
jgi:peptide/nickel transport system substrate-binding protein/oligopeptide transport system substrate-binding protein